MSHREVVHESEIPVLIPRLLLYAHDQLLAEPSGVDADANEIVLICIEEVLSGLHFHHFTGRRSRFASFCAVIRDRIAAQRKSKRNSWHLAF